MLSKDGRTSDLLRRLASGALACGAATALVLGLATPASAKTVGQITNWAPGYVFKSASPSKEEVFKTIWATAWRGCRLESKATKSVELTKFQQSGPRGLVISWWNCRDTK